MRVEDWIKHYVPIVNKEIGREDRNEESIKYFMRLIGVARFDCNEKYYLVTMTVPDMWGDLVTVVISFYILPEFRRSCLREVLKKVGKFAKLDNARYISIGSHINKKLLPFLIKQGYEVSEVRRYL